MNALTPRPSAERMRVLYVNWVDYLDEENRGGGVTVYQRNVMRALERREGVEAVFLASGTSYDLMRRAPRWEAMRHGPDEARERRFEIVNAQPLGPGHFSFGDDRQVTDPETEAAIVDFVRATGPYDVVHFNNLEGVPAAVLPALRAAFPDLRLVLALHNYYPFCPQVNLWRDEKELCTDFEGGAACTGCLQEWHPSSRIRLAQGLAYHLKCAGIKPGTLRWNVIFRVSMALGRRASRGAVKLRGAFRGVRGAPRALASRLRRRPALTEQARTGQTQTGQAPPALKALERRAPNGARARDFAERRAAMVAAINSSCDDILSVSDATRAVGTQYGIDPSRARTSYIGTQQAEVFQRSRVRPIPQRREGPLTLGYMGYMRRDKGFFFLLDALEAMPDELAAQLHLVVAARRGPAEAMARLAKLAPRLQGLTHHDGYTHDTLDDILEPVDIGLVPVLWYDNLPQVAIEMHARHIPLLCADRGGAPELSGDPAMAFMAGSTTDFAQKIETILARDVDFGAYWRGARAPISMDEHITELLDIYSSRPATKGLSYQSTDADAS